MGLGLRVQEFLMLRVREFLPQISYNSPESSEA